MPKVAYIPVTFTSILVNKTDESPQMRGAQQEAIRAAAVSVGPSNRSCAKAATRNFQLQLTHVPGCISAG